MKEKGSRSDKLAPEIILSVIPPQTKRIFIAYSGGIDSHVLLHFCSTLAEIKSKITAVYVHHGLQQEAADWLNHCQTISANLGVKFNCMQVNAQKVQGQSPEETARNVRYQALQTLLVEHDVLLLGQHREDQLETVLLQLFRGAGVQGLSGMPITISIGSGTLCRPFLNLPKQAIRDYALQYNLNWIEDPSNKSNDFDRNFLRNNILPLLKQRWPAIDKTVSRSSRHCASSHTISQTVAKALLNQLLDHQDQTLNINRLLALDLEQQHLVIRQWVSLFQLRMPSEKIVNTILYQVVMSSASGNPEIKGKNYRIRRYRDKLFCLTANLDEIALEDKKWPTGVQQLVLADGQQLMLVKKSVGISKALWLNSTIDVRFKNRGEKISLPGRKGHHTLKKLYQENAIPPWERNAIPLIYLNDQLAVVAGLWISADFISSKKEECYQISRKYIDKNDRIYGF